MPFSMTFPKCPRDSFDKCLIKMRNSLTSRQMYQLLSLSYHGLGYRHPILDDPKGMYLLGFRDNAST